MDLIFEKGFFYIKRVNCFVGVIPGADHRKWVILHGTFSININWAQKASPRFWRGNIHGTGSSLTHRLYCCNTISIPGTQRKSMQRTLRGCAGLRNIKHSKKAVNMYHIYTYEFEICSWEITIIKFMYNVGCCVVSIQYSYILLAFILHRHWKID